MSEGLTRACQQRKDHMRGRQQNIDAGCGFFGDKCEHHKPDSNSNNWWLLPVLIVLGIIIGSGK
jgi:hypothetical protein